MCTITYLNISERIWVSLKIMRWDIRTREQITGEWNLHPFTWFFLHEPWEALTESWRILRNASPGKKTDGEERRCGRSTELHWNTVPLPPLWNRSLDLWGRGTKHFALRNLVKRDSRGGREQDNVSLVEGQGSTWITKSISIRPWRIWYLDKS